MRRSTRSRTKELHYSLRLIAASVSTDNVQVKAGNVQTHQSIVQGIDKVPTRQALRDFEPRADDAEKEGFQETATMQGPIFVTIAY